MEICLSSTPCLQTRLVQDQFGMEDGYKLGRVVRPIHPVSWKTHSRRGKSWWVVRNNSWLWGRGQKHHVDPTPWREYGRWTEQSNIQSGLNWLLGWNRPKTRVLTYHRVRHQWKDNWKQGSPQCRHLSLWNIAVLEDHSKLVKHTICTSVFKNQTEKQWHTAQQSSEEHEAGRKLGERSSVNWCSNCGSGKSILPDWLIYNWQLFEWINEVLLLVRKVLIKTKQEQLSKFHGEVWSAWREHRRDTHGEVWSWPGQCTAGVQRSGQGMVEGLGLWRKPEPHLQHGYQCPSHTVPQPQLITTLTSEGTKAWTYICFRHDLQILSTVTGKTVTETGVVGQGQNNQLHPDFLVPLSRISKEEQVYVHWLPWFKTEPLLPSH